MVGPVPGEPPWTGWVAVSEDRALERELVERLVGSAHELGISVTDLLGPRRAFWRRFGAAVSIAEERRERMELGRSWHRRIAEVLPEEGRFEVRMRRQGVIGRIDLLADVPVEVKTGPGTTADRIPEDRPEHVEQLAMYCLLTDRSSGRIVYLSPGPTEPVAVTAYDLAFPDLVAVRSAVRSRREGLLEAMRTVRSEGLPACRWFGRGCEFQEAKVCDCIGSEPVPSSELVEALGGVTRRPDLESRWAGRFVASPVSAAPAGPARFRDLVYPRRSYFLETAPPVSPEPPARSPVPLTPDLYERLTEAIESGPAGEVARLPSRAAGPDEEVVGFREHPIIARTSRAWARLDPRSAVARFPQYALELGFRCATTGTSEGIAVIAFERAETEADRIQVLRYRFPEPTRFSELWATRRAHLREAVGAGSPRSLPPCPAWMYDECPYRGECGCAAEPGRSQR